MNYTTTRAKHEVERHAGKWVETYARIGIAAKGLVYVLLGVLAAMAAFGSGGQTTDKQGVFKVILEQPFGQILLGIVVIGLLGYVVWRMIQAFKDPDGKGSDTEGIMTRIGYFASGLVYLFLAFSGARMLWPSLSGSGSGGSGGGRQLLIAKMLDQPFGQWLVGILAAIVVGKGIYQIYKAVKEKFTRTVKEGEMNKEERAVFLRAGKVGYIARGIVFAILGYFLFNAAISASSRQAQGTEGVFSFLSSSGGPYLLGAVAIGLACYGVFMFVKSKYRYIPNL